jgi:hypothetical protein
VTNLSITAHLGASGGTCTWKANGNAGQFVRNAKEYEFTSNAPGDISSTPGTEKRTAFDMLMKRSQSAPKKRKHSHDYTYDKHTKCINCGAMISTRPCAMTRHRASELCRKATETDTVTSTEIEESSEECQKQQSNSRRRYTITFKAQVIRALEKKHQLLREIKSTYVKKYGPKTNTAVFDDYKTQIDIAEDFGVSQSNVSKWNSNKYEILEAANDKKKKDSCRERTSKYKLHEVDRAVVAKIQKLRKDCKRVSRRFVFREYKRELQKVDPQLATLFKGSSSWRSRFYARNDLVLRKKTNNHKFVWSEREPRLKSYCTGLQKRIKRSSHPNAPKYSTGEYPIDKRMSLDQVPCEWGLNGKDTLEVRGKDVVQIFTGKGLYTHKHRVLQIGQFACTSMSTLCRY